MLQTDGGYLGSDFEAFFSAVVSGAAGVYVGVLLQDAVLPRPRRGKTSSGGTKASSPGAFIEMPDGERADANAGPEKERQPTLKVSAIEKRSGIPGQIISEFRGLLHIPFAILKHERHLLGVAYSLP